MYIDNLGRAGCWPEAVFLNPHSYLGKFRIPCRDHPSLILPGMPGTPYRKQAAHQEEYQSRAILPYLFFFCLPAPNMYETPVLHSLGGHFPHLATPLCGSGPRLSPTREQQSIRLSNDK